MKKLASFLERHEIDRPFFFTMLALCIFGLIFAIQAIYSLIGWWVVAVILFNVFVFLFMRGAAKKPVEKKWVAIAPEKGEISPFLTNGKPYGVVRFNQEVDLTHTVYRDYGRAFYVVMDDGIERLCLEFKCAHLHNSNWTLKQVKISKN